MNIETKVTMLGSFIGILLIWNVWNMIKRWEIERSVKSLLNSSSDKSESFNKDLMENQK